jgi:hypothetical protein
VYYLWEINDWAKQVINKYGNKYMMNSTKQLIINNLHIMKNLNISPFFLEKKIS